MKGFIQGIISTTTAQTRDITLPKRYINALSHMANDHNIIISPADKGGGIVIMETTEYKNKILQLLQDKHTYEKNYLRNNT